MTYGKARTCCDSVYARLEQESSLRVELFGYFAWADAGWNVEANAWK